MNYSELHKNAFRTAPDSPARWIHFPFTWGTPEAEELQSTIWKIESRMWKGFLMKVRDENIQGDLVEFGVSVGNSLEELIQYTEDIGLRIKIYGFDSFE